MPRQTTPVKPQRRTMERGPGGTPADRLVRAWLDGDDAFKAHAEACIAGGRDGVLAAALRKLSGRYEDEAAEEFAANLMAVAEAAEGGEGFDFAELVVLPVAFAGSTPDPAPVTAGLAGSGAFPPEAEVSFAEGWRSAEALLSMSPCALRRVLLDLVAGRPPADLPPLAPGGEAEGGGIVLRVGALIFGTEPAGDDPDADPEVLAAADAARADAMSDAFERWRAALDPEIIGDVVVLPVCPPSELEDEVAAFLEHVESIADWAPALEEIIDFVEAARAEAGNKEVVARLAGREDGVELAVMTRSGRELDRRFFELAEGRSTAEDVRRAVEGVVPIADGGG